MTRTMNDQTLRVQLGERSYDILVARDSLHRFGAFARDRSKATSALVVGDLNTHVHAHAVTQRLAESGFGTRVRYLPPGETQKSLASAAELYDHLVNMGADRRTLVVAVGGGVVGDLAGFVAATYARGIP